MVRRNMGLAPWFALVGYLLASQPATAQTFRTFSTPGVPFPAGPGPNAIAVGDFNGDGKVDVAIANVLDGAGTGTVRVVLGDGHGGFTAALGSPFSVGNNPWSIAVGDFNRDGKPDLAVANDGAANQQPDSISIFLGDGRGGFTPAPGSPIALPPNTGPLSLAVADFNADGKLDLVSANLHNNTVSVFLGNGDGTFALAAGSPIAVPISPWSVAVADFNGDGKPDIAVGSYCCGVAVLLGDGAGHLTSAAGSPFSAGPMPFSIAIGDFNGDGKPDLAVGNWSGYQNSPGDPGWFGNVTILLNDGAGSFTPANNGRFDVGRYVGSVVVADFNQDGRLDIVALTANDMQCSLLLGDGRGGFTNTSGPFAVPDFLSAAAVADVDRDGTPDVVTSNGSVLLNLSKSPAFTMVGSHVGNFTQGTVARYSVTVSNTAGAGPTRELLTVTEIVPTGLSFVSMTGTGWNCIAGACTRRDPLTGGLSYPPITVTVNVPLGAPAQVTNLVTLSHLGLPDVTAGDPTIINRLPQSIIWAPLSDRPYSAVPFALAGIATSGLAVTYTSLTPPVCTVSGIVVSVVGAGACSITASQAGNAIFANAPDSTNSFTVTKVLLIVTPDAKTAAYGTIPAFTARITGFVHGDSSGVVAGSPGFTTNATVTNGLPNVGSWVITPAAGTLSAANYTFSFATGILSVTPATLTVTANAAKVYGAALPVISAAITGFVNGDTSAVISGAAGLTTAATPSSNTASYPITVAAGTLAAANYTFVFVNGTLTITKASTTTGLSLSRYSLVATLGITLPGAGVPTGTVQFLNGNTVAGTVPLAGSTATLPNTAGTYTAVYSGDANFNGSVSNTVVIYSPAVSSVSLSSSLDPSPLGQPVTFTASVTGDGGPPATAPPSGSVQFLDGGKLLGIAGLTGGRAAFTTSALSGGYHMIIAAYIGDGVFPPAQASYGQRVSAAITMNMTATPAAPVFGQTVVVTAGVAVAVPPGFAAPTGTVTFQETGATLFAPGTTLGIATLASGAATISLNSLAAGSHTIIAAYSGDTTWLSYSQAITVAVSPAPTSTRASLSVDSTGQIVLTASVVPVVSGSGMPTGKIQFIDTSNSATVAGTTLSGGKAAAAAGASACSRSIAAVYSGDGNFKGSISSPLPVAINAAAGLNTALAPDAMAALYNITGLSGDVAAALPLTTSLAGTTVKITDSAGESRLALLYGAFASIGQINFVIPAGTAPGTALVTIALPGGAILTTVLSVANSAPGIFTANGSGQGAYAGEVLHVHADGSRSIESPANPIDLGPPGDQVFLVLFATGIRHAASLTATVNGVPAPVLFFGAQVQYEGLDQVNLALPRTLAGAGLVDIQISADARPANLVAVPIR